METEYSNEVKGKVFAYRFTEIEKATLRNLLYKYYDSLDKKVIRVKNNPKNDGQIKFQIKLDELFYEQKNLLDMISQLEK